MESKGAEKNDDSPWCPFDGIHQIMILRDRGVWKPIDTPPKLFEIPSTRESGDRLIGHSGLNELRGPNRFAASGQRSDSLEWGE